MRTWYWFYTKNILWSPAQECSCIYLTILLRRSAVDIFNKIVRAGADRWARGFLQIGESARCWVETLLIFELAHYVVEWRKLLVNCVAARSQELVIVLLAPLILIMLFLVLLSCRLHGNLLWEVLKVYLASLNPEFALLALQVRNLFHLNGVVMVYVLSWPRWAWLSHLAPSSQIMLPVTRWSSPWFTMALRLRQFDTGLVMTRTERLGEELIPFSVAFILSLFIIILFSLVKFALSHLFLEWRTLIDLAVTLRKIIATVSFWY